jgi:16S rRNA (adenine1518-N6/adenine1519-N6)-dimethyltransferase
MLKHKAKKSLGQNFLKSADALRKIILAGGVNQNDVVLEIGPGKGALTEKILEAGGKVLAVEKDDDLLEFLTGKFHQQIANESLHLVHDDILEFDPKSNGLKKGEYKIIANIPYNITGAILKKFLTNENNPERMVLMVQNEVAKRIVARDNKESLLSISVKAYGEPSVVTKVPARYFSPAPKVDSAVILIKNISKNLFISEKMEEIKFWTLLKTGFAHKRKVLAGNLRDLNQEFDWQKALIDINLSPKTRAEDLKLTDWIKLYKNTHNLF